jgi:hypothetical protein
MTSAKFGARPAATVVIDCSARPAASSCRSPYCSTSRPLARADADRKNPKTLMASPVTLCPTPKRSANSGRAGPTIPNPSATTIAMPASTLACGATAGRGGWRTRAGSDIPASGLGREWVNAQTVLTTGVASITCRRLLPARGLDTENCTGSNQ